MSRKYWLQNVLHGVDIYSRMNISFKVFQSPQSTGSSFSVTQGMGFSIPANSDTLYSLFCWLTDMEIDVKAKLR